MVKTVNIIDNFKDDKKNIFYSPDYKPDREYKSSIDFTSHSYEEGDLKYKEIPILSYKETADKIIEDLLLLNEVLETTPDSLKNILQSITKLLIATTIIRVEKNNAADNNKNKEDNDTGHVVIQEDIPKIEDVPVTVDNDFSPNKIPTDNTPFDSQNLFPEDTDIEVEDIENTDIGEILKNSYDRDLFGLKKDYIAKMNLIVQKYIQDILVAANTVGISYENLLKDYDPVAVYVNQPNLQHLHDSIIRNSVAFKETVRYFSKTHSADNTLLVVRALETAYQQRYKYYMEEYNSEADMLESYSNKNLADTRKQYDNTYKDAVQNAYKYLNAAYVNTANALQQTDIQTQAKAELLKHDINIFEKSPEPPVKAIGNTTLVVPQIIAENDMSNRYETPLNSNYADMDTGFGDGIAQLSTGPIKKQVWDFLIHNMNLDPIRAAGIMGNMEQENNFRTTDDGTSLGLMQWTGSRRHKCMELAKANGKSYTDLAVQLSYMKYESAHEEASCWNKYLQRNFATVDAAATAFCNFVERPGIPCLNKRISYAKFYYQQYGNH